MEKRTQFLTGAEAAVGGALSAGADIMFGYPITPSTEILQGWIMAAETLRQSSGRENKNLKYLQTEDETAAGFALIGALLGGKKAFTATAGPGTVLMQDPLSMAENLRLPFVAIIMQRGGPSTGTVNFSQQEVNLSAFGGNGDGLRVVYSAGTVEEMYYLTAKAFSTAWKYRFPTIVLGDGYVSKMKTSAQIVPPIGSVKSTLLLAEKKLPTFLRNCFSSEEQFGERLKENVKAWQEASNKIAEAENYKIIDAKELIIAHGSVAETVKDAIDILRQNGRKVGLFRPITLHPLKSKELKTAVKSAKKVFVIESSLNQLSRIIKYETSGIKTPIIEFTKPAVSFKTEEIVKFVKEN